MGKSINFLVVPFLICKIRTVVVGFTELVLLKHLEQDRALHTKKNRYD